MALVTISGFPCAGKTRRAHELKAFFEHKLAAGEGAPVTAVTLVDDEAVHVTRAAYDDSPSEKPARAALFTAATRSLNPHTITILDSANYIKGFRYQLYCAAREAGVRVATVHPVAPPAKCREWEEARGRPYKPETFENMMMRYEEPSSMARWDSPLFVLPWDEAVPLEDIWLAVTKGEKKPPTNSAQHKTRPPPNTMQVLTGTTTTIVQTILAHLQAGGGTTLPIPSPPAAPGSGLVLDLPPTRKPTLSELQRMKRTYESNQMAAQKTGSKGAGIWTEAGVASGFVTFLQTAWGTA